MASVDNRIVSMKFDNKQFEQGASTTISTLGKLKQSLQMDGANKGLTSVQQAADKVSFGHIEGGINKVSAGFLAMTTVAVTALATITQKAMAAGTQVVKSLTLQPIMDGFKEYEIKMGSIQTILANTEKDGTKLKDVNAALDELNDYADKTIYSFSEMTKTVGLFTNAGIGIEDATSMIKGFSNAAAASGATAESTARAQYQLSQAMTTGTVRLMDWKSLTNAGMGNKNMQTGLIDIANAMGTFEGTSITAKDAADNFNSSLEKEWLTADVMKTYLKIMAGEVTPSQIKAMGLTEEQTKLLLQQAKAAEEAATKVRTFTKLMETVGEAIGSSWAETFGIVIGNFDEATELFTDINNGISDIITKSSEARNKVLQDWKDKGGRDTLIDALHNTIKAIGAIITPIKEAFRDIFPAKTGQDLLDLTNRFFEFTKGLKIGSDTAENLKDTFKGVFSVMSLVWEVIKGVTGVIFDLVGAVFKGSGGFLEMTGTLGSFITNVVETIKNGGALTAFFDVLSKVLQAPIKLFASIGTAIADIFSGPDSQAESIKKGMEAVAGHTLGLTDKLNPLEKIFRAVGDAIKGIAPNMQEVGAKFAPFITKVQEALTKIGQALKAAFDGEGFDKILKLINTGIFAGILMAFRKFADGIKLDFGQGGIMDSVSGAFDQLTGTLSAMQANIKADTLMKIAGAVALLTASIVALSFIDSDKLTKAMIAITGAFAQLLTAMGIMTKITGMTGFVKIPVVASGLVILAGALLLMSVAVKNMSSLSWNEVAKGLVGIGGSLALLLASMKPMTSMQSGLMATGAAVILLAAGLNLMASAVKKFGNLDFGTTVKGLGGIATVLIGIGVAAKFMPDDLLTMAASILMLSVSFGLMASAVEKMGSLSLGEIVKGLLGLAGALGVIAGMIRLMPENMPLTAAGLILVSIALKQISDAVVKMGGLSIDQVVVGLIGLGGALGIIAVALNHMNGALMGAAALTAMAFGVSILVPALIALSNVSIGDMVKALGALIVTFLVMGGLSALLAPLAPVILSLAAAFALLGVGVFGIGAGFALAGAGVLMFATGLSILVGLGGAVVVVIGNLLNAIIAYIPKAAVAFAEGIVKFTQTIAESIPAFVESMGKIISGMMRAIREKAPEVISTMSGLLSKLLNAITEKSPEIVNTGFKLLKDLLRGIGNNIEEIVFLGSRIITKFIKGIGDNAGKVADEGAKTIVKLVNAMPNAIRNNSNEMNQASRNLADAVIRGFASGITSGMTQVINIIKGFGSAIVNTIKKALGINSPSKEFMEVGRYLDEGLAQGISQYSHVADSSVSKVGSSMLSTMKVSLSQLNDMVNDEMNTTPVIAPVLDLSSVQTESAKLNSILKEPSLELALTTNKASDLTYTQNASSNTDVSTSSEINAQTPSVSFVQNNYSPKAISPTEIYRQTRNQLSMAKGELDL